MRYVRLTLEDRRRIEKMWRENETPIMIAAKMNISLSTVYKEVERGKVLDEKGEVIFDGNFRPDYSAERGQATYSRRMQNCGRRKQKEGA